MRQLWVVAVVFAVGCGREPVGNEISDLKKLPVMNVVEVVSLSNIIPESGPAAGGTRVELRGSGFTPSVEVYFGDARGLQLAYESPSRILVTTPAHAAGAVRLRVVNPGGYETTVADGFAFEGATSPQPQGRTVIEAESFIEGHGVQNVDGGGATWLGFFDDDDSVRYNGIDFGDSTDRIDFEIAVPGEYAGQSFTLHLDHADSPAIGELYASATASWFDGTTQSATIATTRGVHDLWLVGHGAYGVANIDRFTIAASGTVQPPAPPPPAPPPPPPSGGEAGPRIADLRQSGPIIATSGMTISGLRINNPSGPCIVVTGISNVTISDSDLGPCGGGAAVVIEAGARNITVEHLYVHDSNRGVLVDNSNLVDTRASIFERIHGTSPEGTAIEYDYMAEGGVIDGNIILGVYDSDATSAFESSNVTLINNVYDVTEVWIHSAAFTIGDSRNKNPGHDNYAANNRVRQSGGVAPGVFGSSGNTILENNCLENGIQAYSYEQAPFVGVTVRNNIIGPDVFTNGYETLIHGWGTNTFAANPSCL